MLGKRIINTATGAGAACTTDTVQILGGVPFQSIATYELDGDATNLVDTGYIGKAGVFNGSSSVITLPSALSDGVTTNADCISFWFNVGSEVTSSTASNEIMSFAYSGGSTGKIALGSTAGALTSETFSVSSDITTQYTYSTTNIPAGWNHAVVQWNSGTTKWDIYINGVAQTTYTFGTNEQGKWALKFGQRSSFYYDGLLDQVRIFNKALSSSEVTTLYGETSASSTKSTTDIFGDSSGLALYEFEGNANDTGGTYNGTAANVVYNEYDGTASNVTYSTGKFGQAGDFNGSSSYIDLGSTIDNPLRTEGAFGASFWFNANSYGSDSVIFKLLNDIYIYIFLNASNQIECRVSNSSGVQSTVTFGVSLNTWYHIVWTGNSTNGVTLYVNGSSVGNAAWDGTFFTYTNTTYKHNYLGYNGGNLGWYNGSIDQVRIYDKALSASDVTTLYNETVATASTNITLEVPSLVAYYKMSDATDETGSYNGTPTNVNFNVAGKFGNAGEFNGSSSYIDTSVSVLPATNYSVSMWVLHNSLKDGCALYTQYRGSVTGRHIVNSNANGTIQINTSSTNSLASITATPFTIGVWQHLVITKSSSAGYTVYIDGSSIGTWSNTESIITDQSTQFGGDTEWSGDHWLNGKIDQIRIFDRAITANEVTTLYNEVYCQPTIVPTDHFEPVLYTGNNTTQSISTLDFQPDFTWIKSRSDAYGHILNDSVRGANRFLYSNTTEAEDVRTNSDFSSFNSDGFTLGTNYIATNGLNKTFVAWNWKAANTTTTIAAGTVGNTIASDVRANTDAGFSIVKYQANATQGATIGHGLSSPPEMIITKEFTGPRVWCVYHKDLTSSDYYLELNTINSELNSLGTAYAGVPNSSTYSVGNSSVTNDPATDSYIAYCFHSVDGMSKIGSYVGNGGNNSIVTGFRPAFVMIKPTSLADNWLIYDNKRGNDIALFANLSNGDTTYAGRLELNSNGFTINTSNSGWNGNNASYIFMAFAEEVFNPNGVTRNATNPFGDASELALYKFEDNANDAEGSYNGTASNVTYATGYIDKAAVFNGSSSDISLPFNLQNTAFSISFWAKNTLDSNNYYIIANNSGSSQSGWHIGGANSGGTVYNFRINNGSSNYLLLDSATVDDTDWHHVVVTWDNTTNTNGAKIYINGSLSSQGTSTSTTNFSFTNSTTQLMREPNGSLRSDGNLDQVRIFNRALDAGEVTQLYNE